MGSRMPSHQLPSGLVVSGRPDKQPKDRGPTMASRAVPYTGGDVKKSGELGKMFDIDAAASATVPRTPRSTSSSGSGQFKPPPGSGSGSIPKRTPSGQLLPATGLITSGPVPSTPTASMRRSESLQPKAAAYPAAVTSLGSDSKAFRARVPWAILCLGVLVVVIGVGVGIFVLVAMKNVVVVAATGGVSVVVVVAVAVWNWGKGRRAKELERFVAGFPDAELRGAKHGEFVKVTGIVTCGSIPLETSYEKIPRCVYVSTELYEYRGCSGKPANSSHHRCSWGLRHVERHVADFYISDTHTGLRAIVKAGHGMKVAGFMKPTTVVDITKENRTLSPGFLLWLAEHNLSSDDRVMRLKEGYIKEGNTVTVMGVLHRHENVLMIIPPSEPQSTGIQWKRCFLSTHIEGLIITCEEDIDAIPV
ncbi:hypothetical protein QJS04_geneDACA005195 [Acorus gramineus]|uniref:Ubiquitin-specific protease family C19-related protein n=1 Tax=Acorus gramineus TaxID=55184 RepID=A0AAV9AYH3_ACOGR|nr:hypothetical protein QJS04_geneDACA005195 [Acorus gramineus]